MGYYSYSRWLHIASDDDKIKVWNSDHQLTVQFGNKVAQQGESYSILGMALDHNGYGSLVCCRGSE